MAGTHSNGEFSPEFEAESLGETHGEFGGHEAAFEDEMESALHGELTHEGELGLPELAGETLHEEQFFGKMLRGVTRFVGRAAPMLGGIAKMAAPMLMKAVGGPLGGPLGGIARGLLGKLTGQGEFPELAHEGFPEGEFGMVGLEGLPENEFGMAAHEGEFPELAHEGLPESEFEGLPELQGEGHFETLGEVPIHEVMAEVMAEAAAGAVNELEAEAMAGAAAVSVLSARDRAALRALVPHLVRGVAVLTRILRRRRITRPAVRAVPTIFRHTIRTLRQRAAAGEPITRRLAGQVLAGQTRRILGTPRLCAQILTRNVRTAARGKSRSVSG